MFDNKRSIKNYLSHIKSMAMILIIGWIIVIMGFLGWEIRTLKQSAMISALIEARASHNKDLAYRRWATLHGGVYVPATEATPPNPYLINVKEQTVSTPSGKSLTLMNPAYMTRQVHELAQKQYGVKGHITSLNLIHPQNKPDYWENKALHLFETGKKETYNVVLMQGEAYLRFMRPMLVEKGCLKCHGYQGYQIGDVRGGISVSVPMAPYNAIAANHITKSIFAHLTILLLGLAGLGGGFFSINQKNRERLLAEEKEQQTIKRLKESEKNFRSMFERAPLSYQSLDENGNIIEVNETWVKILGYERHEVVGRNFGEFLHPDWREHFKKNFPRFKRVGEILGVEFEMMKKNGDLILVSFHGKISKTQENLFERTHCIFQDITTKKISEQALIKSEEKYRHVFENSVVGIFQSTPAGSFIEVNSALATMLGFDSPQELINKNRKIKEQFYATADVRIKYLQLIQEKGEVEDFEFKAKCKDGTTKWLSESSRAYFDDAGNATRFEGIIIDIDNRKKIENELKASRETFSKAFQNAPLLMTISSIEDGRCLEANKTFVKATGYKREIAIGSTSTQLNFVTKKDREKLGLELRQKGRIHDLELNLTRADGTPFVCLYSGEIIEIEGQKRLLSIAMDITEQKTISEQLQQAQKMESIGNLAGGIAHDFNNILFPIIGLAEMLTEDLPPNSPENEHAREIMTAGKRGSELVKQILAFSRQNEHTLTPIQLQLVMKEVLKLSRASIPMNIAINQHLQQDCGLVLADSTQLHQIGMNLITNAYQAVKNINGKINVEVREITIKNGLSDLALAPGSYAMLSVSDNGMGIEKKHLDKIFDPYFTTKDKGKGTGLGLSVVYGIVKKYKGDIKVMSDPGTGTTFQVYLPLMKTPEISKSIFPHADLKTGMESILLVDDEAPIARVVRLMLERLGYCVSIHTSSLDALEAFKAQPDDYDLVISDMSMPQMTGEQLAREILAVRSDIPIIICTGFSEHLTEDNAKAMGIKGFLLKPVIKSAMAKEIRRVLDGK